MHLQKLGANASKPGVKLNFAKKVGKPGLLKDGKLEDLLGKNGKNQELKGIPGKHP